MFFQLLTILMTGLFAGAAIYISLVEHPARMECEVSLALLEFAPSYKRAARLQASLAALGFLAALGAWISGAGIGWLIGGLFIGAVIPFTVWAMFPINKQLLSSSAPQIDSLHSKKLLTQWGRLHLVRGLLSFSAFLIFLMVLIYHRAPI